MNLLKNLKSYVAIIFLITISCSEKKQINQKELIGQYLFFDTSLSINISKSCSSCHNPNFAFSDGYRQSITALGESTLHNAPSLINVSKLKQFDWANPTVHSLEKQMLRPLFGTMPIELGTNQKLKELRQYLNNTEPYKSLIGTEFGTIDSLKTEKIIIESIAAYLRVLNSSNSKFDKYLIGKAVLTPTEKSGMNLFFSQKLACASCHTLPNFTLADTSKDNIYRNTGLYNVNNKNIYPENDNGLVQYTGRNFDNGKFKIPSLRNIMLTSPYMHDGSVESISEVIDIYAAGGRNITTGNNRGDGRKNKFKDKLMVGFNINSFEKKQLLSFLQTLTDSTIFTNPKFQNLFRNQIKIN